jgi:hypothetical protein
MTFNDIFAGTTLLCKAQRHLSNRKACVRQGRLHCDGAEREAIDLMTSLLMQLKAEKRTRLRKMRKTA